MVVDGEHDDVLLVVFRRFDDKNGEVVVLDDDDEEEDKSKSKYCLKCLSIISGSSHGCDEVVVVAVAVAVVVVVVVGDEALLSINPNFNKMVLGGGSCVRPTEDDNCSCSCSCSCCNR